MDNKKENHLAKFNFTKYCNNSEYGKDGFTDNKTTLDLTDDAARANWHGVWRMPTEADFEELINNTTRAWTDNFNDTGVKGYYFIAGNGKSIFLPAAGRRSGTSLEDAGSYGHYWSSTLYTSGPYNAYHLDFNSGSVPIGIDWRYEGNTVRPVRK